MTEAVTNPPVDVDPGAVPVTAVPAAAPAAAIAHFEALARVETDCWDVDASMERTGPDPADRRPRGFVLLDVRSAEAFARGHVPGAVGLAHADITEEALAAHPRDTLFVVYCNGPHCNGADRAALRLARLGRPVKKMIGGVEGWHDEGFDLVT